MKKLAIIGASYLQNPLIMKARELGVETHAFAWQAGDVGERTADFFYPISIVEKEAILEKCREIGVDGVATIASDLAAVTAGFVAHGLGLAGNSPECVACTTNKELMRRAFEAHGDPSPRSVAVHAGESALAIDFAYPLIVKPSDRSGSRGVEKLADGRGLEAALAHAFDESFDKVALIEEFAEGREFSVEFVSWNGEHRFLAITEKFTTGAPNFIETGHFEPGRLDDDEAQRIVRVVSHALDSLGVEYGASHSEVKVDENGVVKIIEIGARMGGDFIGSDLVELSTGYDFLKAVIDVALGIEPETPHLTLRGAAGVRFIFGQDDLDALHRMMRDDADMLVRFDEPDSVGAEVTDSSNRLGFFLFASDESERVRRYLPGSLGDGPC